MPTAARPRLRVPCAAAATLLAAGAAHAMPEIIDRVPEGALVVVAIQSPDNLIEQAQSLARVIEAPFVPPSAGDALGMMGIGGGVDTTRSLAMVITHLERIEAPVDDDGIDFDDAGFDGFAPGFEPRGMMLVPVTDFNAFVTGLDDTADIPAVGVASVISPDGNQAYVKNIGGGYAAVGDHRATVEAFTPAVGSTPAFETMLGPAGASLADSGSLITIVNVDRLRAYEDLIDDFVDEVLEQAEQAAAMGAPGVPAADFDRDEIEKFRDSEFADWISELAVEGTTAVVGSMKMSTRGVWLDMAVNYKEGSKLDRVFSQDAGGKALYTSLPNQAFFVAGSLELSKTSRDLIVEGVELFTREFPEQAKQYVGMNETLKHMSASSFMFGPPQIGGMGGGLINGVSFTQSNQPQEYIKAFRDYLMGQDGETVPDTGLITQTAFNESVRTIGAKRQPDGTLAGGIPIHEWQVNYVPDPDATPEEAAMAQQMQMFMQMMGGGTNGYVAATDKGVFQTFSTDTLLLSAALDAAAGGEALADDRLLSQIAEELPDNRTAELYISLNPLMAIAAMFAPGAAAEPVDLPPIGAAVSHAQGDAHLSIFVPAPVIKGVTEFGMGMMAPPAFDDFPPQDDSGTGQPTF